MNDVVLEWMVPYYPSMKRQLVKALLLSSILVFTLDAVLFYPIFFVPVLILAATAFFLLRSWKYEFEYSYVNGDLEISKIIRKEKRKELYRCDRKDMIEVAKGRCPAENRRTRDYTSGLKRASVYTIKTGNEYIYVEPNEGFIEEMKLYRKVLTA
ncbi:MAG: hypothetical protein HFI38_09280 [Lachnospiraceae bacterium]|jgi:hypothetical protein|nr:hypothetical protein [Lachnospiraceae bacterium]